MYVIFTAILILYEKNTRDSYLISASDQIRANLQR